MKRLFLLIGALLVLAVPTFAQDDNTPEAAINAAFTAAEDVVGERATSFTFQLLGLTTDSTLGCPLVQGEELPFEVTAVRVAVRYTQVTYTVYSSISGQITILCDAGFDEEILAAQVDTENVCTITPVTQIPAYTAPNATLEGVFTANTQPYRVYGLDADGAWYQIASEAGLGWVEATSVTIAGNCDIVPVTSVTNPDIETACFITPQGGFTNVRSIPSTDGQQVARIYENQVYQATARNTAATWYYIEPAGWVSNTVTFTEGDCTNITVNDNAIGIGFSEEIAIPLDADTATIIERFTCPEDFVGYLAPRISTGTSTAQVEAGNLPNTLRAFPSVDDTEAPRLGVIQPARVLDRVIAGPACNQGFVWWYVEIDGVAGWTAESNFESDDYFLEPTGETGTTTDTDTTTDTS
ncbi:MAG: hypothetical protein AAFR67_13720, partial [Chloroflexota bacterium]